MGQRQILCIEPDASTVAEIRSALSPYGYEIESIPNGDQAIDWARTNPPALIILSVEPRKVGYAVCNKIKRSPSLRDIPLLLISAEETEATFEQHKKLKSRADEYLLKPFPPSALVASVAPFLGLGAGDEGAPPSDEIQEADSGDIVLADDDISSQDPDQEDERQVDTDRPVAVANRKAADTLALLDDALESHLPSPTPTATESPFDAEQFDRETQAAFAALEAGAGEGTPGPAATPPISRQEQDLGGMWSDDIAARLGWNEPGANPTPPPDRGVPDLASFLGASGSSGGRGGAEVAYDDSPPATAPHHVSHDDFDSAPGTSPSMPSLFEELLGSGSASGTGMAPGLTPQSSSVPLPAFLGGNGDVPPSPEDVEYPLGSGADEGRVAELQAALAARDGEIARLQQQKAQADEDRGRREAELTGRIRVLEGERTTLRQDVDDLRERLTQTAQQGSFSKEREFLGLREIINKKEKDILDLRDALDAKEREILDRKDKIREHERARRDLEERTLGFEKSLMVANEKVAELFQDKEKSVERERNLKARLDDAHEEIRKAQEEIEGLRRRLMQSEERARAEVERVRVELEAKLAEAEDAHRIALGKAADERASSEAAILAAHQAEAVRLEAAHKAEVEALQRRLNDDAAAASERLATETARLRREHDKAIASLKEEQALQLASERQSYEASTEQKERAHRDELVGMRRRHEEELAKAEERRQRDIAEHEERRLGELEQAETRRRAELQTRDEEHHARVTELERRHLMEKAEMAERHRVEQDQALGRAARAEGELAARVQEVEQAHRRAAGLEADLNAARAELGDREVKLGQARDRIGELDAKVTDYEEQIVRAYQRLRNEEKTSEKVRRALTVAFALMDERAATGNAGASLPAAPAKPADEDANAR
jgi:CheY-like chemotaxis protein